MIRRIGITGAAAAALLLAGIPLTARPALAAGADDRRDVGVVPCRLPAGAATSVPAPFHAYMELACTQTGQNLRPVKGYYWKAPAWAWTPRG